MIDAIEALVFEDVVDHLAADQRRIGKQLLEHRLQIAARDCGDEAVDVVDVDLRPEAGGRRSGSVTSRGPSPRGDLHGDGAAQRMADQMGALDAQRVP